MLSVPSIDLDEIATSSATSSTVALLHKLNTEHASDEPSDTADQAEGLDCLPVAAKALVIGGRHAEEGTAVDCFQDQGEANPPADRQNKVGEPGDLVRRLRQNP